MAEMAGGQAGTAGTAGTGSQQQQTPPPGQGGAQENGGQGGGTPPAPASWADFYAAQPQPIQALFDNEVTGLKSALSSERDARGELEKQVRSLAATAEKGSELETKLNALVDESATQTRRMAFYEEAHDAGVRNLKLAFRIAEEDNLIDRRGNVDFATLRDKYPEIFVPKTPTPPTPGNAGSGTGSAGAGGAGTMNDFIRRSSGRQT